MRSRHAPQAGAHLWEGPMQAVKAAGAGRLGAGVAGAEALVAGVAAPTAQDSSCKVCTHCDCELVCPVISSHFFRCAARHRY